VKSKKCYNDSNLSKLENVRKILPSKDAIEIKFEQKLWEN
jgi:hypothetical protein